MRPVTEREALALAKALKARQGRVGLPYTQPHVLLNLANQAGLETFCDRVNAFYGRTLRWVPDQVAQALVPAVSHLTSRTVTPERRHRGFGLCLLLFILTRQAATGCPSVTLDEMRQRFDQVVPHLQRRLLLHLEHLRQLGLVKEQPAGSGSPSYTATAAGRSAFSIPVLQKLLCASQGLHFTPDLVVSFFGLPALALGYVGTGGAEGEEENGKGTAPALTPREEQTMAVVMALSDLGGGLDRAQVEALAGPPPPTDGVSLLERANRHYQGMVEFRVSPPTESVVAFTVLPTAASEVLDKVDVGAAVMLYLFLASPTLGRSG